VSPVPGTIEPLLAICVPTFNRASSLRNLFRSLGTVKARFGDEIEICISNNGSTDDTCNVIEEFARSYPVVVAHQKSNIGATLNIIKVAGQMSAHWGVWCGDDDEIDPDAVGRILLQLRVIPKNTWVLVDSAGSDGQGKYMQAFKEGTYELSRFRRAMIRTGLGPFGFMGVHLFPRSALPSLMDIGVAARPWPPIICMLLFLARTDAKVYVLREIAIHQAKGGALLFWNAGDLARVVLARLHILAQADSVVTNARTFHRALMFRELYTVSGIGLIMAWKLYEPADFDANALRAYRDGWCRTGAWIPLALPHIVFTILLRALPHYFLTLLFKVAGRGHFISRYAQRKQQLQDFDGIKRGL
jgi:glycosyltransferase involved in cell wall biosynthesis